MAADANTLAPLASGTNHAIAGRPAPTAPTAPPAAIFVATLALAALSFALTWLIEAKLYALHVFDQYDVWFETDPNYYLPLFARAAFLIFNARHPALGEFVAGPIALAAKTLVTLGLPARSEPPLREFLALLAVPAVAALRTTIMATMFRRLLGSLYLSVLLCLVDVFAASTVTVCSVPESYAFTAACLAATFFLTLDDVPRSAWLRGLSWLTVSALAIGVTVSNAVSVAILAMVSLARRRHSTARGLTLVAALLTASIVVDAAVALCGSWSFGHPLSLPGGPFAPTFVHAPSISVATGVLWAMAHTFLAPTPGIEPQMMPWKRFDFMFSYAPPFHHGWASAWRAGATLVVLALGAAGLARQRSLRPVLLGILGILAFNFLIHLYYGLHYNLYAGHWEPALLVVMAGTALLPRRWATVGSIALSIFTLLAVASSTALLRHCLGYVAAHPLT